MNEFVPQGLTPINRSFYLYERGRSTWDAFNDQGASPTI
jgi:hypothetical protein